VAVLVDPPTVAAMALTNSPGTIDRPPRWRLWPMFSRGRGLVCLSTGRHCSEWLQQLTYRLRFADQNLNFTYVKLGSHRISNYRAPMDCASEGKVSEVTAAWRDC
jgi:hypothetical protein